jgi:hypothetical protein
MYSALPLTTDIAQQGRHVRSVPDSDIGGSPIRLVRDQASARSSLRASKRKTVSGEQADALKHIELLVGIHA